MYNLLFTVVLLAFLCGVSCRKQHDVNALENTTWHLKKLVDGNDNESVPKSIEITATFTEGQLTGSGGCNDYWADYTATDDQMSVTLRAATKIGCPTDWEARYFAALRGSQSWELSGSTLTIQCADALLLFKK